MPADLPKARELFLHAVGKLPADQWPGYVSQACAGDVDLEQQVGYLLQLHREAGSFLELPAYGLDATVSEPMPVKPGMHIGPYKLLQQIGEGGMGTVFMAEQSEPVQRRVALKIIKPGMDSRQVIARFAAEKQALALMDHVNIARVLDAGVTEQGRPYFVMELVHGIPITKYCDDNHLTPRQRLELFVPVCQAIQHAHQKGIIHRDIKPSNVMITLYDGKPVPKVIDFGVAKATEQKLTEQTLFTQYGTMVGTLEYMSPEQAEMSALGIDTRSDIYSLGVLLYELLTGSTPLSSKRIKEAAYAEILRLIKEEEPPKPSTRLSESGEGLASISAQRHTEPAKLSKLMRGELDWIVMKTLEKDRNRRYETANAFAADVQRYLNDETVQACPPSTRYRVSKALRRNKTLFATATMIALGALATVGILVVSNQRISREVIKKEAALDAAQKSETNAVENLKDAMAAVDQMLTRVAQERLFSLPQMEPIRKELLQDALNFYQKFLDKKTDDPSLKQEAAKASLRLAQLYGYLGQNVDAEKYYLKAFAMFDELGAQAPLEPNLRTQLTFHRIEFANSLRALNKGDEFEKQMRLAVQMAEALVKEFPDNPHNQDILANADLALITILSPDNPKEIEKRLRRNLTLTDSPDSHAEAYNFLAGVAINHGRNADAEQAFRQAVQCWEQAISQSPSDHGLQINLGSTLRALSAVVAADGRLQEAEEVCRRAVTILDATVADHPSLPNYRRIQADAHGQQLELLKQLNRAAESEQAARRFLHIREKIAADFPSIKSLQQLGSCQFEMAQLLIAAGKSEEASQLCDQVLSVLEKLEAEYGKDASHSRELALSHATAAGLLANAGRMEDANQVCLHALAHSRTFAERLQAADQQPLARLYHELGRRFPAAEQEAAFRLALETGAQVLAASPKHVDARWLQAHDHRHLAFIARPDPARLDEVEKHFETALELFESLLAEFPENAEYRNYVVATAHELVNLLGTSSDPTLGNPLEALAMAERAVRAAPDKREAYQVLLDTLTRIADKERTLAVLRNNVSALPESALAHHYLGVALQRQGDNDEAIAEFQKAMELCPDCDLPHAGIANLYAAAGQWDKAAASFAKAIELKPDRWQTWNERAFAYFHSQQWGEAESNFSMAAKLAPHVHSNWFHLGHVHLQLAQWDKAAADFTKVVEGWPAEPRGWYLRSLAYAQSNQPEKAVADLRQAMENGFNDVERLQNDPKLEPLRSNDNFKKLLVKLEAQKSNDP